MEDYNRSNRYRNDSRSSSDERRNDINWDRGYNRNSNDRNNADSNVYSSDRERDYWNAKNYRVNNDMGDRYWNRDSYIYADNDRDHENYSNYSGEDWRSRDHNFNSDYNRNYNNDNNRNFYNDDYYRNNYNANGNRDRRSYFNNDLYNRRTYDNNRNFNSGGNNRFNERYRNEGWRDNYRDSDRNWWDRTRDEVASWFGDEDAERRRRRDDMSGSYRGKGPKNYTRSEDRIREDVSDKLSDDDFLDASNIEVSVKGSEVTLNGKVDSRYSKHRAEDLTEDVTGVTHVQNNLRVSETTPQEPAGTSSDKNNKDNKRHNSEDNLAKNKRESYLA